MSDVLKIELENIQAIEKASIEVEGFTAVVGRSNSGKSSIIRGILAALTNKSPKSLYRTGTKKSRVSLDDDAGNIHIEWEKGSSVSPSYKLNGEEHTKVGKEVPPQVADWGFKDIRIGDDILDVQFAKQHRYLFLLDKSGAFIADFISKITRVDVLSGSLKDCESDLKKTNESIKSADEELEHLALDISKFENLDSCGLKVGNLFDAQRDATAKTQSIEVVKQICIQVDQAKGVRTALQSIPDATELNFDIAGLKQVCEWADEAAVKKDAYIKLKQIEGYSIPDVTADFPLLRDMSECLSMASKTDMALPEIEPFSLDMTDIKEIDSYVGQFDTLSAEILDVSKQLTETHKKQGALQTELDNVLHDLGGICPLCKTPLGGCKDMPHEYEKVFQENLSDILA